ncbi:HpcH/HpaI aldolase/citrate lyase family protein [Roseococcus suduntuyensis]|uniref:Citrate lyase subunit beta/citryl-CoA lyase n=1 Tax=Roseococcus suduntuyensis TaxID=455361 RepID=A0A840ABD2_9PROT|nr:aldolase/citrate lyase family protein [Roseococcus suduntuyensis]MBB3897455.1 citrate lyase subunit beta/citryl-CoA lyase [Roseococcus suduntuyensis]
MNRIWRSMLYVPANVPRFVAKSATAGADAVLLDLEDSVPPDRKAEARAALAEAVPTARGGGADVLVRVNRPLALAVGDIEAAMAAGADGILLTKALGPDHVQLAAEMLAAAPRPMRMIVMIETAAALPRMTEMARASPLVAGLLIGAEDLAAEIGAAPDDEIIALAKRQMVLAAVAAGVAPLGTLGTVADYRDAEKLRALVARSRRAGLVGASCIHPSVVPILNEGFSPGAAEVDLARRQLAAAEAAAREGRGSFVVDGMMVDEPILIRARRTLSLAGG